MPEPHPTIARTARQAPRRLWLTLAILTVAGTAPGRAHADRVVRLIRILQTDQSYKVRLQAVIGLGRLKDKRAIPALLRIGLADEAYAVRALAASALGRIGDGKVVGHLKRALASERHKFVRSQLQKAIKSLGSAGPAIGPGVRFYVTVGKIGNKAGKWGSKLSKALEEALLKEFGKVSGVTTRWTGGRRPRPNELRKRRIKGFVLDGAVLSAVGRPSGGQVEVSCSIKVSLATYPANSMKAFYSGGAAMQVSAGEFTRSNEVSLFKEVLAGAATGARKQIVSSYLSAQ